MELKVRVVNPKTSALIPPSWLKLGVRGFPHDDIGDRVAAFCRYGKERGMEEETWTVLEMLGQGFLKPFSIKEGFDGINAHAPHLKLKMRALKALEGLSEEFGDRVSSVVWRSLAALVTRDNPTEEVTIPSIADRLPYPYWMVDAVLHALGKVYGLKMHIDSRIWETTGMILEHNCDCNHALKPVSQNGSVNNYLPRERWQEATAALFTHTVAEALFILKMHLPFALGLSPEAKKALQLQGA